MSSFGKNFAILNLDLMTVLIDAVKDTPEGQSFVSNCSRWNKAVHNVTPRPLIIFSSLHFHHGEPELAEGAPFSKLIEGYGTHHLDTARQLTRSTPQSVLEQGPS